MENHLKLHLYNTLSRSIETFTPIDPTNVKIYSCGPTVYSRQHLGNLRAAYFVDLLKNTIRHICGYPVTHVMNITDVGHLTGDNEGDADHGEDRMEKGARQQGITARDVAKKFTDIYNEDLTLLHIDPFEHMPKATDHIAEQIAMVKELEDKGYTYIIPGDGVYMDTSKVENYGVLTNKKHLENIESGSRVEDAGKKNPTDFALWKFNISGKKRDMERESPRGIGFPGRHIECSAMSMKYLGDRMDIHTGGMEHIAIHHTNEIVQSECSHGHTPWVNYRVHYQRLMMNGKKIAKSDGNVAFLNEVIEKGYAPEDLRYFYLQAHYRSFQDFTREGLEAARKGRSTLKKKIKKVKQGEKQFIQYSGNELDEKINNVRYIADGVDEVCDEDGIYYEYEIELARCFYGLDKSNKILLPEANKKTLKNGKYMRESMNCLLDDLNTAKLLATLGDLEGCDVLSLYFLNRLDNKILKLGLFDIEEQEHLDIPADIQALAEQRRQAKQHKNRSLADELRDKLKEYGWEMKDGKESYELTPLG